MIRAVGVTNFKGEYLRMELTRPEKTGFAIYNIEGIGGGTADINTTDITTGDGARYNSARAQKRNIVIYIKLLDLPDVETNRHKTYRYFPVKKPLTLEFETDNRTLQITGYVESNNPIIFSSQEYTQISILCPDPYFYDRSSSTSAFSGVTPMFSFPFSNESLTEKLIEFGSIRVDDRAIIDYKGDADSGVLITIHAMDAAENITIYNVDTREMMSISTDKIRTITGSPFTKGDDIIISTVNGNKYVKLLREGIYTNIIGALNKNADWFVLTAGANIFTFTADSGANNLMITFSYRNAYEGV